MTHADTPGPASSPSSGARPTSHGIALWLTAGVGAVVLALATLPRSPGLALASDSAQVCALAFAVAYAWRVTARLDAGNPMRSAWLLLAAGLAGFLAAESADVVYGLRYGSPVPYPSAVDAVFIGAYLLLAAALALFIRAYAASGYPLGDARTHLVVGSLFAAGLAWVVYRAAGPVLAAPGEGLGHWLDIAYPAFDAVLLLPTLVLIRMTLRFRGGRLWRVWAELLIGFLLLFAGDLLFTQFGVAAEGFWHPAVEATYGLGYVFLARGGLLQYELLR